MYIYIYQYVMCKLVSSINPSDASSGSILPPCWSPAIRTRWLWRPSVWIYKVPRCTERFSVEKHLLRMQLQWTWGVGDPTWTQLFRFHMWFQHHPSSTPGFWCSQRLVIHHCHSLLSWDSKVMLARTARILSCYRHRIKQIVLMEEILQQVLR